jgi:tRNA 5-methylaminomethyl-2-thiouridine biosynthesis bifunctional protein
MMTSPLRWDDKGVPHSIVFDDKYFCTQDGYAECYHVAAIGNDLPARFSALDPKVEGTFTIIETGFGTGLSFCCAWKLWQEKAPATWTLKFISIEMYPLPATDIDKALSTWTLLDPFRKALVSKYKPSPNGVAHFHFEHHNVHLILVFEEAVVALKVIAEQKLSGEGADAWFLNGFSPFKNPLMWRKEVFEGMVPLSKMGTTLSTFTVAAAVRHGLEDCGFEVLRVPGFGTKKTVLAGIRRG